MWPVWSQTLISDVSCHLLDFLELNFPWTDSHLNLSTSAEKPPSCLDDGISRDEESSTQHEILFPVVNSLHYETCLFSIDHSYLALILRPWVLLYLHQLHHQRICIFQGYIFQPMALSVFFYFFLLRKLDWALELLRRKHLFQFKRLGYFFPITNHNSSVKSFLESWTELMHFSAITMFICCTRSCTYIVLPRLAVCVSVTTSHWPRLRA